ncbi:protein translocase subunit SecF [Sulfurospirillum arcachonense]|uniref:protein translocase subunit SecF n=1 Tax=Sulfurospirillum arcachonense TaxID=57666 RepID=UPI0004684B3E|nr:protein translocase subunit SecF [Sulfurospirillum arcachonense]
MQIFSKDKTYNFMGKSLPFIIFSLMLIIASYVFLGTKGLNYGIDFSGGTIVQVKYEGNAPIQKMRDQIVVNPMFANASITEFGAPDEVVIRFMNTSDSVKEDLGDIVSGLLKGTGTFEIRRVDIVGPKVGGELREKGIMAMIISIIAILIYITIRFEWRFAVASIIALVHDISIAMGALALFEIDVNLDILAALLTLLGYSLNDTIIVFDRIREEVKNSKSFDLFEIINFSISKTLTRTLLTSLTTFFVVLTLWMFGGEIIHGFGFTLLVGIIIGTYSSIFVASPLLKWLKFNVEDYKKKEAMKEKRRIDKEKMRAQYEQGIV